MRKPLFLLLTFAIAVTTARGVSASTDCQKWLADYKKALSEKTSTQKLLAAKHRARAYAHRKLAALGAPSPKPTPTRVSSVRPHLTPAQMLKRFDLLCGELPMEAAPQILDARMQPDEFVSEMGPGDAVSPDTLPTEAVLLASNQLPAYDSSAAVPDSPSTGPFYPVFGPGSGGGGSVSSGPVFPPSAPGSPVFPPSGPGTPVSPPSAPGSPVPPPTTPGTPVLPPVPPSSPGSPSSPIPPTIAPVPEPSSIILLLTGGVGAVAAVRRRIAR